MFDFKHTHRGFIQFVIVLIIALIILGYFGFNMREILQRDSVKDNLQYAKELVVKVWQNYLRKPILYFWNEIFLRILWDAFIQNMEDIRNGRDTELDRSAPQVPQTI
jgi:hypothetical protein